MFLLNKSKLRKIHDMRTELQKNPLFYRSFQMICSQVHYILDKTRFKKYYVTIECFYKIVK